MTTENEQPSDEPAKVELFTDHPAALSLAEIPAAWIAEKREMIRAYGYALRAGADASIEFKSLRPDNAWLPLLLPNRATQLTTVADRDALLAQLTGPQPSTPSPQLPTP